MEEKRRERAYMPGEDRDHGNTEPGMTGLPDGNPWITEQVSQRLGSRAEERPRQQTSSRNTPSSTPDSEFYGNGS